MILHSYERVLLKQFDLHSYDKMRRHQTWLRVWWLYLHVGEGNWELEKVSEPMDKMDMVLSMVQFDTCMVTLELLICVAFVALFWHFLDVYSHCT